MIAYSLTSDPVTKMRFRAASLDLAARVLREGGMTSDADRVDAMDPAPVRVVPRDRALASSSIFALIQDSDTAVRSTRRSGLRYVALLLRAEGLEDAAAYLERSADEIPTTASARSRWSNRRISRTA